MKVVVEDTIANRIKEALNAREILPIDLSKRTGIPKASISQYMSGYVEPKTDRIYAMSVALRVDPVWLMGFPVPMEKKRADANLLADITNDAELVEYAHRIWKMPTEQRRLIFGIIDNFKN